MDSSIACVAPFMLNKHKEKEPWTAWKIPTKYQYIFTAGMVFGYFFKPFQYKDLCTPSDNVYKEVDCVAGSLLMVNNNLMNKFGMYDEAIFLFGEETTLGCKFKSSGCKTVLLLQESFLHMHGTSFDSNIKSEIKKRKILLNSRRYILKHYLNANPLDIILAKIVYSISTIELYFYLIVKKQVRKIRNSLR